MATIKKIKKAQAGDTLRKKDLDALSHQKRGMGQIDDHFVKKAGGIKNELGTLTPYQKKQLGDYMGKAGTAKKIYEGLPNVLIEAQLLGIPVVATNVGGSAETFIPGETGIIVFI